MRCDLWSLMKFSWDITIMATCCQFEKLSWVNELWWLIHTYELRVSYHHYIWGLFESRWAIPIELSIWSLFLVMNYIDELFWLLKFFLLYVLWDFRVILWDRDLAPRVSLDGTREGILYKVYSCSLTMYAKHRGPWWPLF